MILVAIGTCGPVGPKRHDAQENRRRPHESCCPRLTHLTRVSYRRQHCLTLTSPRSLPTRRTCVWFHGHTVLCDAVALDTTHKAVHMPGLNGRGCVGWSNAPYGLSAIGLRPRRQAERTVMHARRRENDVRKALPVRYRCMRFIYTTGPQKALYTADVSTGRGPSVDTRSLVPIFQLSGELVY